MSYSAYESINSLEEVKFIAGTEYTFEYSLYDENGSPISLAGSTCKLVLCPYGQPEVTTLVKTGAVQTDPTNKYIVVLSSNDTKNISGGKYIQQPLIIDISGAEVRLAQGVVTIIPRIKNS